MLPSVPFLRSQLGKLRVWRERLSKTCASQNNNKKKHFSMFTIHTHGTLGIWLNYWHVIDIDLWPFCTADFEYFMLCINSSLASFFFQRRSMQSMSRFINLFIYFFVTKIYDLLDFPPIFRTINFFYINFFCNQLIKFNRVKSIEQFAFHVLTTSRSRYDWRQRIFFESFHSLTRKKQRKFSTLEPRWCATRAKLRGERDLLLSAGGMRENHLLSLDTSNGMETFFCP